MGKRVTMRDANGARLDFPTELARNPHGTEFYFPYLEGDPWFIPAGGWLINKPGTQIVGDGLDEAWGFRLAPNFDDPALGGTGDSVAFILSENRLHFERFSISNDRGPIAGTGSAFLYRGTPTLPPQVGNVICQLTMDRVYVLYAGAHGFLSDPPVSAYYNNNGFLIVVDMDQCWFYGCGGNGVRIDVASTTLRMKNVWIQQNGLQGLWVNGASTSKFDVICENNGRFLAPGNAEDAAIYLRNCVSCDVTPYAENIAQPGVRKGVLIDGCEAVSVRTGGGLFDYSGAQGLAGVQIRGGSRNVVEPLKTAGLAQDVVIEAGSKRNVIFPQGGTVTGSRTRNTIL